MLGNLEGDGQSRNMAAYFRPLAVLSNHVAFNMDSRKAVNHMNFEFWFTAVEEIVYDSGNVTVEPDAALQETSEPAVESGIDETSAVTAEESVKANPPKPKEVLLRRG